MDNAAIGSFRRDAKVIGLVASAHCLSHFLQLTLPPLFVFLKHDFDVTYTALGALVSVFYVGSGLSQFAAGFAVDRFGARPVLFAGIALLASGTLLAGTVPAFPWLFPLAAIMGIGNGVFHPADFAILNARVDSHRLGHAFSTHGVGGSLGYALAPLCSYALGQALGWRVALFLIGSGGLAALAVLAFHGAALATQGHRGHRDAGERGSIAVFRQIPILLCFLFFCLHTTATVGIQTFAAPALNAAYGISLAIAASAITAYLMGSTAGIIAGGFLAARTRRHERVAASGLAVGAGVVLTIAATPVPATWLVPLLVVAGFALGSTGPSRDLIVRAATPAGASGRTYGFVYSGLDLGATIAPVLAGRLLDHGTPRLALAMIAASLGLAILTVVQARRSSPVRVAVSGSADGSGSAIRAQRAS